MMAPEVYQEFRRRAPMHVQLWRTRGVLDGGVARIHGRVIRIFRDRDRMLHLGARIAFAVPVINPVERSNPVPSGTIYLDWEWLGRARWLEAFLDSWQGEIHLVHSQVVPLAHPTRRPVCGPDARGTICEGTFRRR